MEDLNAKGGSYQRQPDGSLKLVNRTEEPKAKPEASEKPAAAKVAKSAKDTSNG